MAEIKVSAQQLNSTATELRSMNAQFSSEIDALNNCQQQLNSMWEGDAKNKFNTAYNQDREKMNQFKQTIDKFITALEQIAQKYQNAEQQATGIAGH